MCLFFLIFICVNDNWLSMPKVKSYFELMKSMQRGLTNGNITEK